MVAGNGGHRSFGRNEEAILVDLGAKTILLTGSSSGIGAATAKVLAQYGATIVAHHRDASDRAGAEEALAGVAPERRIFVAADFADNAAVDALWRQAVAMTGRVDVLVLNAAMLLWGGIDDDDETWDRSWSEQLQVNAVAPARLMRNAVRHWREIGGGVLITLSSWNAQRGATNPGQIAYTASKAAVKAAAQTIARGYAAQNILSYVISPGIVRTRMSEEFAASQPATGKVRHLTGATLDINGATYVR
jgi:NAD(P)-dependent dehydrogenase (short-subunit alcohol dehydrogenase family)